MQRQRSARRSAPGQCHSRVRPSQNKYTHSPDTPSEVRLRSRPDQDQRARCLRSPSQYQLRSTNHQRERSGRPRYARQCESGS